MKSALRVFLSILISAFFLWLVLKGFDFGELKTAFQNARWGFVLLALVTYPLAFLVRSFRWSLLLSKLVYAPPLKIFPVLTFGFLVNNILPARAGEFARAFAAGREFKQPASSCLGSIAIERLTDIFALVCFLAVAILVVDIPGVSLGKLLIMLFFGSFCAVFGFFWFKKRGEGFVKSFKNPLAIKVGNTALGFLDGFSAVGSPSLILRALFLALIIWGLEAVTIGLISHAFGIQLSFLQAVVVLVGMGVGAMIPAAPGYIGTMEYFASRALGFMNIVGGPAISFVLFLHFFQYVISSALGFPYLIKIGFIPKKDKPS